MRSLFFVAALLIFSASLLAQTHPPYQGRIVGTVVDDAGRPFPSGDDAGKPFSNAIVCFAKIGDHPANKGCSPADARGQFDIRVPIEINRVYAEEPEAGYLDDEYLEQAGVAVNLSPAEPAAHVVVKMGPKPAQLTFKVSAKDTKKLIQKFWVTWLVFLGDPPQTADTHQGQRQSANSIRYTYSTPRNRVFVPSNRDVLVFVHAHGYRHWFYLEANAGQPVLRFQPGEERTIAVELEPVATQK
jgi:hypothetical protein